MKSKKNNINTSTEDAYLDYLKKTVEEHLEETLVVDDKKHDRFIHELENCLNIISDQIVVLRRLADKELYEYKPFEVASAFDEIEDEIRSAKAAYLLEGTNISLYQHSKDSKDKPIICLETREVFTSVAKAAKFTGINGGMINSAVHTKLKTAGGYHWEYYMSPRGYLPTIEFKNTWAEKSIIDSSTGTVYKGVKEAAKKNKLSEDIIYEAIMNNKPYDAENNENIIIYMYVNNHTFQRIIT